MPHILIVADEPATAWALTEGLTDDGYTLDTVATAEAALEWLGRGRCDLVIADVRLSGLSGLELARRVRRARPAPPVILLTAYGPPATEAALRRQGVAGCFTKPFPLDLLRHAVRSAIERRSPRRPSRARTALRRAA